MFGKIRRFYVRSFQGLSVEIWLLSLVTLVNRAGTMVIPFIALYLTSELGFSLTQIGWVMTSFGLGSLLGSWIGGKLSDLISYYYIMVTSLILTGLGFISLIFFKSFLAFCLAIFFLMVIADAFRPATFTAINAYTTIDNRVRSITLIRLAINLGFSVGPAIGGFLIFNYSYSSLFFIDGFTCIAAALLLVLLLRPQKKSEDLSKIEDEVSEIPSKSVWKDKPYLLLTFILFLVDFIFIQLYANIPLFYRDVHALNENTIGWLLAMNGILIFLFEMPLVSIFEFKKTNKILVLFIAIILIAASYFFLNTGVFFFVLVVSMVLITFGEMLAFPFSNTWAMNRAPENKIGSYMGLYTMAFSLSHILGPNIGMRVTEHYGFNTSWILMGSIGIIAAILCLALYRIIQSEDKKV